MIVCSESEQTEGLPFVIVAEKKPALLVLTICSDSSIWWTNTKKAKTLTARLVLYRNTIIPQRFIMDKKMWIALAKESYHTLAIDFLQGVTFGCFLLLFI